MKRFFTLLLLVSGLSGQAATQNITETNLKDLPQVSVIFLTNQFVMLSNGVARLVSFASISNLISSGSGGGSAAQVWTNDLFLGYIRLAQFNNADFVDPLHAGATNSVSLLLYRTNVPFSYSYAASIQNNSTNNSTDGWYYENVGTYGLIAQSSPNELCMGIGIGIYTSGGSLGNMNVGLAAEADPFRSGQTNVASASFVPRKGFNSVDVGSYAEIQDPGFGADPLFETSVLLADSRDSGTPLLILRTNNGTFKAFQVNGNLTTNATYIASLNGFASYATNATITVLDTGITNNTGRSYRLFGLTGVSILQTNTTRSVGFSRGTITVPSDITLQNGEFVTGSSIAVQDHQAF